MTEDTRLSVADLLQKIIAKDLTGDPEWQMLPSTKIWATSRVREQKAEECAEHCR